MKLPDPVDVTVTTLRAIAERHAIEVSRFAPLPTTGIINTIYLLGDDFVLRVPRNHPAHVQHARREAVAVPAARGAGVRTPRLVAFDDSLDLLPVPYTIYERVQGESLEPLHLEPADTHEVWRELGHDLARLHTGVPEDGPAGPPVSNDPFERLDPRTLAEQRASDGWFSPGEARWLIRWLDRLAPTATPPVRRRFTHADVQAAHLMVSLDTHEYLALIDWGCAHWADPALDYLGFTLRAVPYALEGHRQVALLDQDETAEARILWQHLTLALHLLPRGAAPECSWGEQPTGMLLDILRYFLEAPGLPWKELAPPVYP